MLSYRCWKWQTKTTWLLTALQGVESWRLRSTSVPGSAPVLTGSVYHRGQQTTPGAFLTQLADDVLPSFPSTEQHSGLICPKLLPSWLPDDQMRTRLCMENSTASSWPGQPEPSHELPADCSCLHSVILGGKRLFYSMAFTHKIQSFNTVAFVL